MASKARRHQEHMAGRRRTKVIALWQAARYPQAYVWFIFVSALDLMMTWVVLYFGGREVNALADFILQRWQLAGMVVYKFALVVFVICICEIVGHFRSKLGRRLAWFGVLITLVPVIVAFSHLLVDVYNRASSPAPSERAHMLNDLGTTDSATLSDP